MSIIDNLWNDIYFGFAAGWNYLPFWVIIGGIAAFALLIYWLFSRT